MGELAEVHDEGCELIHKRLLNKSTEERGRMGLILPPPSRARARSHARAKRGYKSWLTIAGVSYQLPTNPSGSTGDIQRQERSKNTQRLTRSPIHPPSPIRATVPAVRSHLIQWRLLSTAAVGFYREASGRMRDGTSMRTRAPLP